MPDSCLPYRTVYVMFGTMTPLRRIVRGVSPWIVLWLAAPLGGPIAYLALGPTLDIGSTVAGGALIGLAIGAAQAWALRRPLPRWTVASAIGLAVGSGLSWRSPARFPGRSAFCSAPRSPERCGNGSGHRRSAAAPGPLDSAGLPGWMLAWGVSLALAIDARQGFGVFGATGSLVFAALLAAAVKMPALVVPPWTPAGARR